MNHAAIIRSESERPYQNRAYILSKLDSRHFDALNPGGLVLALNGYCLDALDELPAGCMSQFVRCPAQHYVSRGVSLAEQQNRDALAQRLIAKILAEEAGHVPAIDHEAWKRAISAMPEPVMMTEVPDCVGHSKPMPAPEQPSATDCETEGHAWEHFDHIHASCTKCGERMEYPF